MCDFAPVRNLLIAAGAMLALAITFGGLAIAALVFVWTWWAAPALTAAAAGGLLGASACVNQARNAAYAYASCMLGGPPNPRLPCWGAWQNFRNAAVALTTTLGLLAANAGIIAGSLMGWWSAPPLATLIGAIAANVVMLPTLLVFLGGLAACLQAREPAAAQQSGSRAAAG